MKNNNPYEPKLLPYKKEYEVENRSHFDQARAIVESWPKWKQDNLIYMNKIKEEINEKDQI